MNSRYWRSASSLFGSSTDSSEPPPPPGEVHTPLKLGFMARRLSLFPHRYNSMPVTPTEVDTVVLTVEDFVLRGRTDVHQFPKLAMQPLTPCRWKGVCFCTKGSARARASLTLDPETEVFTLQVNARHHTMDLRFRADSEFYKFKAKARKPNVLRLKIPSVIDHPNTFDRVTREPWRFPTIVAVESYRDECNKASQSMTFALDMDTVSQSHEEWRNAVWVEATHGLQVKPTVLMTTAFDFTPVLFVMDVEGHDTHPFEFDQADISLDMNGNEVLVLRKYQASRNPKYSPIRLLMSCANLTRMVVYY